MNAPEFGDLAVGDQFQKHSYPFGILINAAGKRFVDEGADFRNYTYAKYGRAMLEQPGQFAWQIFDQKVKNLLHATNTKSARSPGVTANTIEDFAEKLDDMYAPAFLDTIKEWNAARPHRHSFRSERQGRALHPRPRRDKKQLGKLTIDTPPFEGYAVTCGITFTFIKAVCASITTRKCSVPIINPIRDLYAAGELVGGLFYFQLSGRHRAYVRRGIR